MSAAQAMFIVDTDTDAVSRYDLTTKWDLATASFVNSFSIGSQEPSPGGVFFRPDGTRMFVIGTGDTVFQYDLSTAWDLSTAAYNSVNSGSLDPFSASDVFFRGDGLRMFVTDGSLDDVFAYDLASAWDVTTPTYVGKYGVDPQDTNPTGVFFRDDGTRMFVIGSQNDSVYQYNLGTAWNVGTAVYAKTASVPTATPTNVFFSDDGTIMFYTDSGTDTIYRYNLSNPWDIGIRSSAGSFTPVDAGNGTQGVFFAILNTAPNAPTNLQVTSLGTDTTPVFSADISDPDTAQQIKARFEVRTLAGVVLGTLDSSFRTGAGTVTAEWADALALGEYQVRAKTIDDAGEESAYTAWVDFTITQFVSPISLNLIWNVIGIVPKELSLLWDIAEGNQKDLGLVWNTAVFVSEDLELLWNKKTPWTEVTESTDIWRRVYQ